MHWVRFVSAAILLVAAAWIGALVHDANSATLAAAGSGRFAVEVVGPDGGIYNGTVEVTDATVYRVLVAASTDGGFEVQSYGSGADLFVVSIAGHANSGDGGWCYAVWDDAWVRPARSAGAQPLADGQASRWTYEADGCGSLS